MISIQNISIQFSGDYLFNDVSFLINRLDRIGLVGKNGAGKTTLLKVINGDISADSGQIAKPNDTTLGYLPQEKKITEKKSSIFEEALSAFSEAIKLKNIIHELTGQISTRVDYNSLEYFNLISKLNEANDRFALIGGHSIEAETEKVLIGLGFEPSGFNRKLSELSQGWQMRIELAKILLQKPDLLLLDEPTNHLDIESIQWLEEFVRNYKGAVILVSHDRALLDNVTNRTIEITSGRIYDFKCSYSEYVKLREEQLEQQLAAFTNQQRQVAEIERFVERFRYKSTKAKQVQSRIKKLDKLEKTSIDHIDNSSIYFKFPSSPPAGKVIFEAQGITKKYESKIVLNNLVFSVINGDSIAFVGRNGEGKTTLSKILVNELEHDGNIIHGHNVIIGYYAQNQSDLLDGDKTVLQTIDDVAVGEIRTKIRSILGNFLFSKEDVDKKVKVLSGGEKSRLALAKLLLSPVNVLILDEPTNHLDMQSKDILKNALLQFGGTLIVVSHDRDFLQGLTNKVFEFKHQSIKEYIGDIYDFLSTRKIQSLQQLEKKAAQKKEKTENSILSENKIIWEKKKELDKEKRKLINQIAKIEGEIENLEKKLIEFDQKLVNPNNHLDQINDPLFFENYKSLKSVLEQKLFNWEDLHYKLESI